MQKDILLANAMPHHFCISVGDRDEAVTWWHDVFGFELDFDFEIPHIKARGAFIRKGPFRIEVFEIEGSAPTPERRLKPNTDLQEQGVKHFCFAVEDVQAALEAVYHAGINIVGVARGKATPMLQEENPCMEPGKNPASAFFITDPWGSLIEVLDAAHFAP